MPADPALQRYRAKRDFSLTPEPSGGGRAQPGALQFVVQKHWASHLHYDFRLELDGTMKSWAVPKGPSLDPADKRMAVHVEDHPIAYNRFEGRIPAGQYGAGRVIIWDKGRWVPIGDPARGYRAGKLEFELHGHKLHGRWTLVRMHGRRAEPKEPWLLIKGHDEFERAAQDFSIVEAAPDSVASLPAPNDAPGDAVEAIASAAPRHTLPATLAPMLATLVDQPPADAAAWLFEVKFDGYRVLAHIGPRHGVRLMTRNGHDWSKKLPHLVDALAALKLEAGWLDGEIVMPGERGVADFQALQNAFDSSRTARVQYHLFDIPFHAGRDLRGVPLEQRRALLQALLAGAEAPLHFSDALEASDAEPAELVASACRLGLEGLIGKRRDSTYASGRSREWIKLKCSQRQEFVIGGWTEPKGSRTGLGALLLGVHDADGALRYAGKVGSGFDERGLGALRKQLDALAAKARPFAGPTDSDRDARWVRPRLVAEVTFSHWTREGRLRHPVFHALRADKPAKAIVREEPVHALGPDVEEAPPTPAGLPARLKVSHPARVIDVSTGTTKLELVRYYAQAAPLMLEHLRERPVALLRAPRGIQRGLFFQKHVEDGEIEGLVPLDPALDPGNEAPTGVASAFGIVNAAQMNVVEFHAWNALRTRIDRPDRLVFDLDPGEGVGWAEVRQAAELLRALLDELGLVGFLKTSGGKGLHVVVPIKRLTGWEAARGFAQAVVQHMADTLPERFVAKSGPKNRVGKIFIDYLRNGFGATTVCAWSARARPGLGVSVPISWDELAELDGAAHWTVRNIGARLAIGNKPWARYPHGARGLSQAMKRLGYAPPGK